MHRDWPVTFGSKGKQKEGHYPAASQRHTRREQDSNRGLKKEVFVVKDHHLAKDTE